MIEHSDMQENWNVAHWLETSAAVLFISKFSHMMLLQRLVPIKRAHQNSLSPGDPTLLLLKVLYWLKVRRSMRNPTFISFTPSTCSGNLWWHLADTCTQLGDQTPRLMFAPPPCLHPVACRKRFKLAVKETSHYLSLPGPSSLGGAKLNSNKHFWHFRLWVQQIERVGTASYRAGLFPQKPRGTARWSLQSAAGLTTILSGSIPFHPPSQALSPYPSPCTPVFFMEALTVFLHIKSLGNAKQRIEVFQRQQLTVVVFFLKIALPQFLIQGPTLQCLAQNTSTGFAIQWLDYWSEKQIKMQDSKFNKEHKSMLLTIKNKIQYSSNAQTCTESQQNMSQYLCRLKLFMTH